MERKSLGFLKKKQYKLKIEMKKKIKESKDADMKLCKKCDEKCIYILKT